MHTPDTCRCSCHLVEAKNPRHRCSPASYAPRPTGTPLRKPSPRPSPAPVEVQAPAPTPRSYGRVSRPLKEDAIEQYLDLCIRRRGGLTYKFAPLVAGNPDRIVLAPHGAIHLVELKAPHGEVRPDQRLWHERALKAGHYVHILSSKSDVDDFVRWAIRNATASRRPTTPPAYDQQAPDAFDEVMAR